MDVIRYREAIKRTMNNDLTDREKLSMLALGIAGEAGEVVDKIKKVLFHGHTIDIPELIKELGDLEWYLQHLKMYYEISDEKVRMENIQKLNKRYIEGFSEEASRNREEYKGVIDS